MTTTARAIRYSTNTKIVLAELANHNEMVSFQTLIAQTRLKAGSLHPILQKFQDAGWLSSEWRTVGALQFRFYVLTALGRRHAQIRMGGTRNG